MFENLFYLIRNSNVQNSIFKLRYSVERFNIEINEQEEKHSTQLYSGINVTYIENR